MSCNKEDAGASELKQVNSPCPANPRSRHADLKARFQHSDLGRIIVSGEPKGVRHDRSTLRISSGLLAFAGDGGPGFVGFGCNSKVFAVVGDR